MKNLKVHIVLALLAVFVIVGCTESLDRQVKVGSEVKVVDTSNKNDGDGQVKSRPVVEAEGSRVDRGEA